MRIDAHQHYWDLSRFPYPWMPPEPSPLRRDNLPADLEPILKRNRFDGSVVVQATTVDGEADWLLSLADEHASIRGVVAWVDLTGPDLDARLDVLQRHPRLVGIRHPVHDEPDVQWLLRPDVLAGLRALARRGLPYDLLLRPPHLPLVPQLADAVPDLRLVLDHIGKPRIREQAFDDWVAPMEAIAALPQVAVKLSGMITEADWANWTAEDLRPYVQHVLRLFGTDRVLFGSDWPVCLLAGSWKEVLAGFTQACGPLPQETREKLLGGNAERVYGM